jgi:hypothetical protein
MRKVLKSSAESTETESTDQNLEYKLRLNEITHSPLQYITMEDTNVKHIFFFFVYWSKEGKIPSVANPG